MSGTNPFRRKNIGDQSFSSPTGLFNSAFLDRPEARISPIDTDVPPVPKTKTGKTVRIISPHSASSDTENGMPRYFSPPTRVITSPPPPDLLSPVNSEGENHEDPFGMESDGGGSSAQDGGTLQNTLRNSGDLVTQRTKGKPANPFAKTLASLNTEIQPSPSTLSNERRDPEVKPKATRPLYDVNDFKRLLLTGENPTSGAPAPAAPPVSFQSQPYTGDTNSNTDASSVSRQSIFEPISGPLAESPRTSDEGSPSDDERQQLVGNLPPSSGKPKPPAPRPRHGKLVKANGPQTVSFEDSTLSFASSTTTTSPDIPTPTSPATPSSADKPLPALPSASNAGHTTETTSMGVDVAKRPSHSNSPDMQASPTPQKRNAPPPPLSRRHSLRPKPFAASERSSTISEEGPVDSVQRSSSPSSVTPKVPPPPPPRRSGPTRGNSSSSVSTSASIGPSTASSNETTANTSKPRAPAPPSSSPTLSAVKRQSTQPFPGSPAMAPPPPPRRRGSSASNNYMPSRLSGNYSAAAGRMRSDSGASSISQLQMTSPTPNRTDSKDVMADLSALQREVDELRGKFKD